MSELDEETCPWCNGVSGKWEFMITKKNSEVGTFEKCRACYGLGKILRQATSIEPKSI